MVEGSNLGLFRGQLWCNNHPQSQPNLMQTIEATRLVQVIMIIRLVDFLQKLAFSAIYWWITLSFSIKIASAESTKIKHLQRFSGLQYSTTGGNNNVYIHVWL
jgi:hypothetical protein